MPHFVYHHRSRNTHKQIGEEKGQITELRFKRGQGELGLYHLGKRVIQPGCKRDEEIKQEHHPQRDIHGFVFHLIFIFHDLRFYMKKTYLG